MAGLLTEKIRAYQQKKGLLDLWKGLLGETGLPELFSGKIGGQTLEQGIQNRLQPNSLRPALSPQQMVEAGLNIAGVAPVGMVGKLRPRNALGQEIPPKLFRAQRAQGYNPTQAGVASDRAKGATWFSPDKEYVDMYANDMKSRGIEPSIIEGKYPSNPFTLSADTADMYVDKFVKPNPKDREGLIDFYKTNGMSYLSQQEKLALEQAGYDGLIVQKEAGIPKGFTKGPSVIVFDKLARPRNALGQEIPPTQYELAHQTAQRNAALPVEQGGLGLPAGNTAMDRARAMGFDTDAYHGTNANIAAFDHTQLGAQTGNPNAQLGTFATQDPSEASRYTKDFGKTTGGNVIPLTLNAQNKYNMPYTEANDLAMGLFTAPGNTPRERMASAMEIARARKSSLINEGYDSALVNAGHPYEEIVTFDPKNIRSRFAAFDPMKRNSADLLAGLAPYAAPFGAGLLGSMFLLPPED